jgi:hypothetical protein
MYYQGVMTLDSLGKAIKRYTIALHDDKTMAFYDAFGNEKTDFDSDVTEIIFEFIKVPGILTVSYSSYPEVDPEYHEALTYQVIADLYTSRSDIPTLERLQWSKHFKSLFAETQKRAEFAHHQQYNHQMAVRMQAGEDFAS